MKKFTILFLIFAEAITGNAQTPELIFGNTTDLSVINYSPAIDVVQYNSGNTFHNFDLNTDGNADISLNIDRVLSAQIESAFITFPNAAAEIALHTADDLTVIAFKDGDSLLTDQYSFDFDESAFDGALLYVSNGSMSYGQFSVNAFRYLAFRIISVDDTLYGWLRMKKSAISLDSLGFNVDQLAYQGELTDIVAINAPGDLQVYPTITDDELLIESNETGASQARLYNLSGKLLLTQDLTVHQNVMHLNEFPPGMYLLLVTSASGEKVIKVVRQ